MCFSAPLLKGRKMAQWVSGLKSQELKIIRKYAFQYLYQQEINQQFFLHSSSLYDFFSQADVPKEHREFLRLFLEKIFGMIEHIDKVIQAHTKNWKLSRISKVDLALLRLACYELMERVDTDTPVIISEAVNLANEFGSTQSYAFVNGVLEAISSDLRKNLI